MSKIKLLSLITVVFSAIFSGSVASKSDEYGKEETTWCERDCSYEYKFFKRYAGQGSSLANLSLAIMNYRGHGREINIEAGNSYLYKAARGEEPLAMYQLGYFFMFGLFVEQDIVRATNWFKKAAAHNVFNSRKIVKFLEAYMVGGQSEQAKQVQAMLNEPAQPTKYMSAYEENKGGDIERISVVLDFNWSQAMEVAQQQTCKTNCDSLWGYMLYPRIRVANERDLFNMLTSKK